MAINLWKTITKVTGYNPLTGNPFVPIGLGDYVISFYAYSPSSTNLRVYTQTDLQIQDRPLTPTKTFYSLTFNSKKAQNILFGDTASKGDIIITDIQLVQKPLSKLTINGIDGFKSGKWSLHANAVVQDDETLVLNATGTAQRCYLLVNVLPNTNYSVNCEVPTGCFLGIYNSDATVLINGYGTPVPKTFNTGSNTAIRIYITNEATGAGTFTFKRPQLNLGTIPSPYTKKTGDKMVLPTAKGNLLPISDFNLVVNTTTNLGGQNNALLFANIPVKPSTTYTLSVNKNSAYKGMKVFTQKRITTQTAHNGIYNDIVTGNNGRELDAVTTPFTFTTNSDEYFISITLANGLVGSFTSPLLYNNFMLNEGQAQPFKPYAVQVNKKPGKLVPKKNLFDGQLEQGNIDGSTGANTTSPAVIRSKNLIPVKPNTTYYLSRSKTTGSVFILNYKYDGSYKSAGLANLGVGVSGGSINTASDVFFIRLADYSNDLTATFQLEEGTQSTAYEPFTQILPRAKTGSAMNGLTDYFQLPSMTMDSIEIDCLIDDSMKTKDFAKVIDARTGLTNGWLQFQAGSIAYGAGWSSVTGMVIGQRTKIKAIASSVFTDDVNIFIGYDKNMLQLVKGTLYKVTCYLAGAIVAQYDFENPSAIVGDKVFNGKPKNLIPSFEDSKWSLHANTQVLGKDVLRLNATGTPQRSGINVNVVQGNKYLISCGLGGDINHRIRLNAVNGDGSIGTNVVSLSPALLPFTWTSDRAGLINFSLENNATGTFDFIKPQLYQLDSKEGTLMGVPKQQNKASRRKLYSKR